MTPITSNVHFSRSILTILITLSLIAVVSLPAQVVLASAPAPVAPPLPANGQMACEVEVEAPRSVAAAYDEYFECVDPHLNAWLVNYPEEVAQLDALYHAWKGGRHSDLRDTTLAAQHVRDYPTNFDQPNLRLTEAQSQALRPNISANPVEIAGRFERLFVDGENDRLFLTSEELGLVSLAIDKRYAFELEGAVQSQGSTDFFIYDSRTAFLEQETERGMNRDLVVLDISNRNNPLEIYRLQGALPAVGFGQHQTVLTALPNRAPTFDEYRAIQEARVYLHNKCTAPPVVSTHANISCRRDRTCYRIDTQSDVSTCENPVRLGARLPDRPIRAPRRDRRFEQSLGVPPTGSAPLPRSAPFPSAAAPALGEGSARGGGGRSAGPSLDSLAPQDAMADAEMPQGGAGGAGSLSQMMVADNTLFVLSATHSNRNGWLTSFDLTNPRRPRVHRIVALDNGPEALQRHDNLLLVAGRDAVITASIDGPGSPTLLGEFRQHCPVNYDPVVVQGSIAYRTIIIDQPRSTCSSRLEIIDLSQPHRPLLRDTRSLQRPRGLAILGQALFVADEAAGIHVFELSDPVAPTQVHTVDLHGIKDLVINGFDLFAMSGTQVQTFYIGDLFVRGTSFRDVARRLEGYITVLRRDDAS